MEHLVCITFVNMPPWQENIGKDGGQSKRKELCADETEHGKVMCIKPWVRFLSI